MIIGGGKECCQVVARLGIKEGVLGQRAGRYQAHDIAFDDRLGAAFPRLGGVFELLADGDSVAELDQLLEVVVGAVDRHAA